MHKKNKLRLAFSFFPRFRSNTRILTPKLLIVYLPPSWIYTRQGPLLTSLLDNDPMCLSQLELITPSRAWEHAMNILHQSRVATGRGSGKPSSSRLAIEIGGIVKVQKIGIIFVVRT